MLAAHDAPLAVVAVAGRYRSGKSFLLSQLCGGGAASAAFSVGHTVESHTRGIWMASSMVPARTAAGERVDVLFLDSEGLGATDKVRARQGDLGAAAVAAAAPPRHAAPLFFPLPRAPRAQNVQHDTTVFSLTVLLCSTLIYNGSSSIDEASIGALGFVSNLSQVRARGRVRPRARPACAAPRPPPRRRSHAPPLPPSPRSTLRCARAAATLAAS